MLQWQIAIIAVVFIASTLAPRAGAAALYVPMLPASESAQLAHALVGGTALAGRGPMGTILLAHTDAGLGWRALRHGALAIRVPDTLCGYAGQDHG